jgi:hypothetical protein
LSYQIKENLMSKSSTSILVFGVYLIGMGAGLLFTPNFVLGNLGFPPTGDIWVRVVGVLALLLAYYYISAARSGTRAFMEWTVPGRLGVFLAFVIFVVLGMVGPIMIGWGAVDLLGALWTRSALRSE